MMFSRLSIFWAFCLLTFAAISVSANSSISSSAEAAAAGKYQNVASSNENEDGYLTQKESILEKSYHGLIRENETLVEITPLIKVDEEKICDFRILKKPYHEIPFQIELVNNLGILKARRSLNCEKRKSYHFEIVAVYCDGTPSNTANVHITVIDINEYAPTFLQPSYVTEVDEGRLYNEIIRVEAKDKDCTPLFGDVCKYEILNNEEPFTIDNEGSIKNTEPLSHKASHNHILSVVAYDCAMKESAPIMVSIKVRRVCEAKFKGIPERIDYMSTSTESLQLFPNVRLDLCDIYCSNEELSIHTSITLKTKHISFGCDRDVSNCSADNFLTNLLPRGVEWTKELSYDEGVEPVFHFDGSTGVIVPESVILHHDFSTRPFSIVTIFRHGSHSANNKHIKEHVVCSADDHKMNRHHMALFVRNCRLILLLRKNFNEGDLNIFSPAEWRWKLPQVCDNEWHHYVLNVDQTSKVELFIDGARFESSIEDRHSNPEVIDDWPLHAAQGVNTTVSVGACYQSSDNQLKHGFNGDISEIKISLNRALTEKEIKCGTSCAEHLLPPPHTSVTAGSEIQINAQMNEIFIESESKHKIEQLMQQIQYINTKQNPTIGRRNIEIKNTLLCVNQSAIRLPTLETYIMVNEPVSSASLGVGVTEGSGSNNAKSIKVGARNEANLQHKYNAVTEGIAAPLELEDGSNTKLIISGDTNSLVSYPEIKSGVHIFDRISIDINNDNNNKVLLHQTLDSCSVIVFPSLNPDHEDIQIDGDESLSSTMEIKTNINKDGVEMIGNDAINNYLNVLRALIYSNKKPAYYLNRVFKLSCTQLHNAHFKSSDFTLTLTVLHPKQNVAKTTKAPAAAINGNNGVAADNLDGADGSIQSQDKVFSYAMIHTHDVQEPKSRIHSIVHKAETSHPTMLIILICVFLVILICGVSIARIKNSNQKYNERHQPCPKIADEGLIWDDSALTITINPMQSDGLSEDSSDSDNSDTDDEDTNMRIVAKDGFAHVNQLEWDNSNMFSTVG